MAVFGGGESNAIQFLTIATTGDATDFGDLIRTTEKPAGVLVQQEHYSYVENGGTRLNTIQFVTIATTGNAIDFGDHTSLLKSMGACTNTSCCLWWISILHQQQLTHCLMLL